jgi:hypothetical protein
VNLKEADFGRLGLGGSDGGDRRHDDQRSPRLQWMTISLSRNSVGFCNAPSSRVSLGEELDYAWFELSAASKASRIRWNSPAE